MNLINIVSLLWALAFAPLSSGFLRTTPDISPYKYSFVKFAGAANSSATIHYNGAGIKSYWWATWLKGDNGHSYCLVITSANAGPTETVSSIALTDITTGKHFGTSSYETGQLSVTEFSGKSSFLEVGSTAGDPILQTWATSTLPAVPFNLSFVPKGPNLYQGGSGSFFWGTDYAYAIDAPETTVHGTFVGFEGKTVKVVPEQSAAWFDLQWGPGYASQGWHDFVILLSNGVKIQATVTAYTPEYSQGSFATLGYPDGHHEVWPVDNNTYPANPWVSPHSNITYYHDYKVSIPEKGILLNVHLPIEGGETGPVDNPLPANTIADTFAWYSGVFDGLPITGYGIMELRASAGCSSFGC